MNENELKSAGISFDRQKSAEDDNYYLKGLLKETLDALKVWGKSEDDVSWVGSASGTVCMTFKEFKRLAENIRYRPRGTTSAFHKNEDGTTGFFAGENRHYRIPADLVIVGDGWWLRREIIRIFNPLDMSSNALVTNSAERWAFTQMPQRNSALLVDGANDILLCAADDMNVALTLQMVIEYHKPSAVKGLKRRDNTMNLSGAMGSRGKQRRSLAGGL